MERIASDLNVSVLELLGFRRRCDGFSVMAGKTKQSRSPRDEGKRSAATRPEP
jgi:hypothetical protein